MYRRNHSVAKRSDSKSRYWDCWTIACLGVVFLLPIVSGAQEAGLTVEDALRIGEGDAYVVLGEDQDGFDLYLRAKPGLGSVLITESSADPDKKTDSFAFRAWDYNSINGDEKRILDGEFLESERPLYFLLDSTPEPDELLGEAFHIRIPFNLTYGYPWSREGQVMVHQGTWLNLRTFEKPYADYSGPWMDNPFVLAFDELPPPPPPVVEEVVEDGDLVERIRSIISRSEGNIDVVLVVDTTISMKDDVSFLRESLVPMVRRQVEGFASFRVGLVLYRDYKEAYLTRVEEFTDSLDELQRRLNRITVAGGRDLPEAVDEGVFAALTEFEWQAPERIVIQVGDAPAHEVPRGSITPEMVESEASRLGVRIIPIRLPGNEGK